MYYVYILQLNNNNKHYTGSTGNLRGRITEHNAGKVISTKGLRPIKLAYYCAFRSKNKALIFERYLKTGSGIGFRNKRLI